MTLLHPDSSQLLKQAQSFSTKKQLGQHFLIDPQKLTTVVEALQLVDGDQVLEIGPGIGFLTRYLSNGKTTVTAVELDSECICELNKQSLTNTNIIHGDFLNFNLDQIIKELPPGRKLKIVGNIPYQITAPIIRHLFGEINQPCRWLPYIDRLVMTIQYEVARRFVAQPATKDYSQITLLVNYYARPEIIEIVPSQSFYPPPQIISAVVKLTPRPQPAVKCADTRLLRKIIQAGFSQRRKMLKNNLASLVDPSIVQAVFQQLRMDPQARAERLSLEQFAMLCDAIHAMEDP